VEVVVGGLRDRFGVVRRERKWRRLALVVALFGVLAGLVTPASATEYDWPNLGDNGTWRTVGGNTPVGELGHVMALAEIGNSIYVGGYFDELRPTLQSSQVFAQPFLAAIDKRTGQPITTFRPQLNAGVRSLLASPDGTRLFVGGDFSSVAGLPDTSGLVALDPATGAVQTDWQASVTRELNNPPVPVEVHTLFADGPWLYVGGQFSHITGAGAGGRTLLQRLGRVSLANGFPDKTWGPRANGGAVNGIAASLDHSRVYIVGNFSDVNSAPGTFDFATLDSSTAQLVAGVPQGATHNGRRLWDVVVTPQYLFLAGNYHRVEARDPQTLAHVRTWISDGDYQDLFVSGDWLYAGSHEEGMSSRVTTSASDQNRQTPTNMVTTGGSPGGLARIRISTLHFDRDLRLRTANRSGLWSVLVDSNGKIWGGGDHERFGTMLVDGFGSAKPDAVLEPLIAPLSQWRYDQSGGNPSGWTAPGFNDSAWPVGAGLLGYGDLNHKVVTTLNPNPLTYRFRTTFQVPNPGLFNALRFEMFSDDGAVVYLNGQELFRENMPAGPVTTATRANTNEQSGAEFYWRYVVPSTALTAGTNTLAVEVHNRTAASDDIGFDLGLWGSHGPPDITPPSVPANLVAGAVTNTTAAMSWAASTDDVGVTGYRVYRNGVVVNTVTGGATTFTDSGLAPNTAYSYEVTAIDAATNESAKAGPLAVTTQPTIMTLIPAGAVWKYLDTGVAPAPTWTTYAFDDSAWKSGAAELGADEGDEVTTMNRVAYNHTVHYVRLKFDVANPAAFASLKLSLLVDDGAVVYLNGVEVQRDNMPTGPVTNTTKAVLNRWSVADETTFRDFTLPASALVAGQNVIAVSIHNAINQAVSDVSFNLSLSGVS
jgi:chitodextrinase